MTYWELKFLCNWQMIITIFSVSLECPICLAAISNPRSLKCKHVFCSVCIETALNVRNKCPVCQKPQGVLKGNQPPGVMTSRVSRQSLPGYEGEF